MNQFEWNGNDKQSEIFKYSCKMGSKDNKYNKFEILQLSKEDAITIRNLYRRDLSNIIIPELNKSEKELLVNSEAELLYKIDNFLKTLDTEDGFFMKTNRHSCKDSPIDHPTENDINLFKLELTKCDIPPMEI